MYYSFFSFWSTLFHLHQVLIFANGLDNLPDTRKAPKDFFSRHKPKKTPLCQRRQSFYLHKQQSISDPPCIYAFSIPLIRTLLQGPGPSIDVVRSDNSYIGNEVGTNAHFFTNALKPMGNASIHLPLMEFAGFQAAESLRLSEESWIQHIWQLILETDTHRRLMSTNLHGTQFVD